MTTSNEEFAFIMEHLGGMDPREPTSWWQLSSRHMRNVRNYGAVSIPGCPPDIRKALVERFQTHKTTLIDAYRSDKFFEVLAQSVIERDVDSMYDEGLSYVVDSWLKASHILHNVQNVPVGGVTLKEAIDTAFDELGNTESVTDIIAEEITLAVATENNSTLITRDGSKRDEPAKKSAASTLAANSCVVVKWSSTSEDTAVENLSSIRLMIEGVEVNLYSLTKVANSAILDLVEDKADIEFERDTDNIFLLKHSTVDVRAYISTDAVVRIKNLYQTQYTPKAIQETETEWTSIWESSKALDSAQIGLLRWMERNNKREVNWQELEQVPFGKAASIQKALKQKNSRAPSKKAWQPLTVEDIVAIPPAPANELMAAVDAQSQYTITDFPLMMQILLEDASQFCYVRHINQEVFSKIFSKQLPGYTEEHPAIEDIAEHVEYSKHPRVNNDITLAWVRFAIPEDRVVWVEEIQTDLFDTFIENGWLDEGFAKPLSTLLRSTLEHFIRDMRAKGYTTIYIPDQKARTDLYPGSDPPKYPYDILPKDMGFSKIGMHTTPMYIRNPWMDRLERTHGDGDQEVWVQSEAVLPYLMEALATRFFRKG